MANNWAAAATASATDEETNTIYVHYQHGHNTRLSRIDSAACGNRRTVDVLAEVTSCQ